MSNPTPYHPGNISNVDQKTARLISDMYDKINYLTVELATLREDLRLGKVGTGGTSLPSSNSGLSPARATFATTGDRLTQEAAFVGGVTTQTEDWRGQPFAILDADYTPLEGLATKRFHRYSGTLTAARTIYLPNLQDKLWLVWNQTGQILYITVKGLAALSGVPIAAGLKAFVVCDATAIIRASGDI